MYSPTQEELWSLYNNMLLLKTQTENAGDGGSFIMIESLSNPDIEQWV